MFALDSEIPRLFNFVGYHLSIKSLERAMLMIIHNESLKSAQLQGRECILIDPILKLILGRWT